MFHSRESAASEAYNKLLSGFDTGIKQIDFHELHEEEIAKKIPEHIIDNIREELEINEKTVLSGKDYNTFLISKDKNEKLKVKELLTLHNGERETHFEMSDESDGTKRLTDLLPLFFEIDESDEKVIFIDEIDRSLHTELTYNFIKLLLKFAETRSIQFVTTTHDIGLLNFDLYRKDEIWFTEKDEKGNTTAYSLEQFNPRQDLNLKKGYVSVNK